MSSADNLVKARKAAAKNAAKRKAENAWKEMEPRLKRNPCGCNLRKGQTLAALRKLGAGCTAPVFVCDNLAAYRRILDKSSRATGD